MCPQRPLPKPRAPSCRKHWHFTNRVPPVPPHKPSLCPERVWLQGPPSKPPASQFPNQWQPYPQCAPPITALKSDQYGHIAPMSTYEVEAIKATKWRFSTPVQKIAYWSLAGVGTLCSPFFYHIFMSKPRSRVSPHLCGLPRVFVGNLVLCISKGGSRRAKGIEESPTRGRKRCQG